MNGHKFVQRQFYQIILCAFCNEFLLNAAGYQCEDCRYTCHKKCYENVVTKCISKSNTGVRQFTYSTRFTADYLYRMTRRKSTTASPIASNPSPTSAPTGAVTAATCSPSAARTRDVAPSATLHVTRIAHTSSPTSAVCLWRLPMLSSAKPARSPGAKRSRSVGRRKAYQARRVSRPSRPTPLRPVHNRHTAWKSLSHLSSRWAGCRSATSPSSLLCRIMDTRGVRVPLYHQRINDCRPKPSPHTRNPLLLALAVVQPVVSPWLLPSLRSRTPSGLRQGMRSRQWRQRVTR